MVHTTNQIVPGICVVSSGSRAKASCSLVMRVVCSGPAITVAGVAGIADISLASVV